MGLPNRAVPERRVGVAEADLRVAVVPDGHQFAEVLRILAEHLIAAADDIEHLDDPDPEVL
jgi:hypothetical protein